MELTSAFCMAVKLQEREFMEVLMSLFYSHKECSVSVDSQLPSALNNSYAYFGGHSLIILSGLRQKPFMWVSNLGWTQLGLLKCLLGLLEAELRWP